MNIILTDEGECPAENFGVYMCDYCHKGGTEILDGFRYKEVYICMKRKDIFKNVYIS